MMIVKGLLILIVMIIIPIAVGDVIANATKSGEHTKVDNVIFRYIFGNVTMWAIFEIIGVTLILMKKSFMIAVYTWCVAIIILILYDVFRLIRNFINKPQSHKLIKKSRTNKIYLFFSSKDNLMFVVVVIIMFLIIGYQCFNYVVGIHLDKDDSRFVVNAVEAYDNNVMLLNNPCTGESENTWIGELSKDVTSPWMIYVAMISKIVHIHPTIMAHTILPLFLLIMAYGIYWIFAKRLFGKKDILSAGIFVIIVAVINMFFNASVYTESTFLLTRVWQGKAIVAGIMIPVLMYVLYSIHQHASKGKIALLAITNLAICLLSGTGLIIGVFLTIIYGCWYMVLSRNWIKLFLILLTCIPSSIIALLNIMIK